MMTVLIAHTSHAKLMEEQEIDRVSEWLTYQPCTNLSFESWHVAGGSMSQGL